MDGYDAALAVLPEGLRAPAAELPREQVAEFRLRRGYPPTALLWEGERPLTRCGPVGAAELARVLELSTRASPYAAGESMASGFVTAAGGVRVGLCGQLRRSDKTGSIFSALSSAAVRVPRQVRGCAAPLLGGVFASTLILSPPGGGKTTLLRDMVRLLSDGGLRTALCDERGELAAMAEGVPGFDIGRCTDVMTGNPKHEAALMLLRAMNPQLLAMDEVTAPEDAAAVLTAANCGVRLLATAHADGPEDLSARGLYRPLLESGVFRRCILITVRDGQRVYREQPL